MDLLQDPPVINLNAHLIDRHSIRIERRRIRKLVSDEDIEDKKPSEFVRTLKSLATVDSGQKAGDDHILKLSLNRLPQVINKNSKVSTVDRDSIKQNKKWNLLIVQCLDRINFKFLRVLESKLMEWKSYNMKLPN